MRHLSHYTVVLLGGLITMTRAGTVSASDTKHYLGSTCAPYNGTNTSYIRLGYLQHTTATDLDYVCPIIRDLVGSTASPIATIDLFDNGASSITCTFYAMDYRAGYQFGDSLTQSTSALGVGASVLVYEDVVADSGAPSGYLFRCTFRNNGDRVRSYSGYESAGSD